MSDSCDPMNCSLPGSSVHLILQARILARRSNQSILKKINPEYSLEGLMLKLKLQYAKNQLIGKDADAGKD